MQLKDIAKMMGVSKAAISIVRTGKPGVSPEMRLRLQKLLYENGYGYIEYTGQEQPKRTRRGASEPCARFVRYQREPLVLAGNESYYTAVARALEAEAKRRSYRLLVTAADPDGMPLVLESFHEIDCEGVLLLATELEEADLERLAHCIHVPVVLMDCDLVSTPYSCVTADNRQLTNDAVRYLSGLGHRSIGYLDSAVETSNFRARRAGFAEALARWGLPLDERLGCSLRPVQADAREDMLRWLDEPRPLPTAFLCATDAVAIGAVQALQTRGYRVPTDLSVMGVDNVAHSAVTDPPLTTMDTYCLSLARRAMSVLMHEVKVERALTCKQLVHAGLVERGSTAPPPRAD